MFVENLSMLGGHKMKKKYKDNNIKYWRHKLQMTQTEFAEYFNIAQSTISKWESGMCNLDLDSAVELFFKLRITFPEIHLEDIVIVQDKYLPPIKKKD